MQCIEFLFRYFSIKKVVWCSFYTFLTTTTHTPTNDTLADHLQCWLINIWNGNLWKWEPFSYILLYAQVRLSRTFSFMHSVNARRGMPE